MLPFKKPLALLLFIASIYPARPAAALCLYDCEPAEFTELKRQLLIPQKREWVTLCGPWSASLLQLAEAASAPRSKQIRREIANAEAGYKLGYFERINGAGRTYAPTQKLMSLEKEPGKEHCYQVERTANRSNVQFIDTRDIEFRGEKAKLVRFTFDRIDGPLMLQYLKNLYHPSIENGTRKGQCIARYDAFKKEWKFNYYDLCEWAGLDAEFEGRLGR